MKNQRQNLTNLLKCTAMGVCILFPSGLFAQEIGDAAEEQRDNVIIVTGQRIDQSLQEIPSSVAVLDSATIEEQNVINLNDVIEQTANITGNAGAFAIRGINSNNVSGAGLGGLASIYIDGSPLTRDATSRSPASDIGPDPLQRGTANRIQERLHGSLTGATKREIERLRKRVGKIGNIDC